ncbi:MAG: HlyU family transcriptional regulator [Gemmobacter sp.]
MPFWSRLFGSRTDAPPPAPGEDHKGFRITPTPIREGGQFRVSARIEKDGQRHDLIRADTMASQDEAAAASLRKARQIIDEQGDRLFAAQPGR